MNSQQISDALFETRAVITDSHIVYTSGKHGRGYVNKDAIYPHTFVTSELCRNIAGLFQDDNVEVVIAPAIGGVILSQWIAYHLSRMYGHETIGQYVLALYAEKAERTEDGDVFVIKRGYNKLIYDKRVLVVEDVLTTGSSVKKVVAAARIAGGDVIGVGALCNRGNVSAVDVGDVPRLEALIKIPLEMWDELDCPLCKHGVPINTEVGKGREFLTRTKK